ncbi:protein TOPAZ1 isoform X4 [Sebastes umbrosus]|uniref:protein TOPAZ1 isoform X4 n=1 Tax=Sebastes umbrosus TaxID=72105 RepID=UPI00189E606E|nr:protein TOPAZ1 isoform X4 [Sebastes umbrosus]
MLGSSSRVKLNRVALKELKLEPRRRRVTKSLSDVQEENQVVSELVSASVSSSHEPVQTSLKGPGNVTDTTANIAGEEGEPEEEMKAEKKRRSSHHQEVKHEEEEGPHTRGERTKTGECRTGMLDRDVEEDPGPVSSVEIHRDKRIKLGDGVKDGILPSTPDFESISCKDPAKTDSCNKEKRTSDDSQFCLEHAVAGSSSFDLDVKENCVHKEIDNPTKTDAAQMSSDLNCERNEVDTDELESFTCQRVRAYFRKIKFSCARTYMSWPFSNSAWKLTTHAGTTGCPAEPIDPSARDNPPLDHNQPGSTNDMLPDTHTSGTTHQVSHQNKAKREEKEESVLVDINGKTHGNVSMEFAPNFMEAEESLASLSLDTATLSNPSQHGGEPGTDTVSASSSPVNRPESDNSTSTPSPSALGRSDWETSNALSPMASPFTRGGLSSLSAMPSSLPPLSFLLKKVEGAEVADSASASLTSSSPKCVVKAVEKTLFCCEETRMTPWTSSSAPPHNSDSFDSCVSSLLLPQGEQESDEGLFAGRTPPKPEPYYNTSPFNHVVVKLRDILTEKCVEMDLNEFILPPMLSPVASPQGRSQISLPPQSPDEEEKEEIYTRKRKMSPGCHMPQIVNDDNENAKDYLEHGGEELKVVKTTNEDDGTEKESQDETDYSDDVEQGNKTSEVPSDPKIKATLTSDALTEPCSSPSSDEDDAGAFSDEGQPCSTSERDETDAEAAGDAQRSILDEFTAYEKDILLVDVIQEDPELFENLPQGSLLKLGHTRVTEAPKIRPIREVKTLSPRTDGASLEFKQRLTSVNIGFPWDSPDADIKEESDSRSWRPHCRSSSSTPSKMQSNSWPATEKQTKNMGQPDANNNHVNGVLERSQHIQTVNSLHKHISPLRSIRNGPLVTNPANMTDFRRQKSNPQYCRQYFSESLSCGFKMCRFQHVPVEGDEKLCVETVTRFTKNPMCLQKAGAVFTGYYQNNPPGAYFSMPVLLCLLWALHKAGMVSDVFSVLSVSLAHKIVPGHEFLLALFNIVREKGLMGVVPELMQLTFKMARAGLVLSLDCLDCVKNTPEFQETVNPNSLVSVSGNHKLSTSAPFPEYLNLAHCIVEIELCTKQEDWRRMGEVFRSICQSSQHPNQVERISGRIAIALLSESKDKLSLPFAAFAETVCQNDGEESLIRSFLGRIGVSLMLRYHKTHQWGKGRRVVEVLSSSKVNYSTLKGLFGNEDGSSRCHLVTVATELFLLSCSLEGALNTLRENKWFLSSCSWPCEPADLESRTRVLMRLAEKTSHRDTLEVLCNLPGLKEPNDLVDVSRYGPLFNCHLRVCVERQIIPVASDTVYFMLSKKLSVDQALLQMLLNKLGKQNLWLRAREVFRHSLSTGYYPGVSAPPGFMELIVPCQLGEVELALTLEMFISVNATDIFHLSETTKSCLRITLKRTQSCESEYLSAGSRILSAACIPQPKLIIHYTAVNSSQDQVFTLDVPSARCWLRHNHLWANEVWTH